MTVRYSPPENNYIQLDIIFATAYGVNEALLFAKLHRLDEQWQGFIDEQGNKWVRLTYEEWEKELPFLSRNTIIRTIDNMANGEDTLIFSTVFSGRSKWYRCNSEFLSTQNGYIPKMGKSSTQNGLLPNSSPNSISSSFQEDDTIPEKPQKKSVKKTKTPIKASIKKETVIPPAVKVYREQANKFPDKIVWPRITDIVGHDPENLEFWGSVVYNYIECGWYKGSVKNMLDFYERREIPGNTKKLNGNGVKINETNKERDGSKLDEQESFDPETGEYVFPDGRREPATVS